MAAQTPGDILPIGERLLLLAALGVVTLAGVSYALAGVGMEMSAFERTLQAGAPAVVPGKAGIAAAAVVEWGAARIAAVFLMWWMMTIAIVTPAAALPLLACAAMARQRRTKPASLGAGFGFLAGYIAAWGGASLVATALQWAMERLGMLSPGGLYLTHGVFAGAILTAVGLYQFSQPKHDLLARCRRPALVLARTFRPGLRGALGTGLRHGLYCVGCCGLLMAVLFFGGIMNLYCILGIAALVQVEHWLPRGESVGLGAGAVLVLWGVLFLVSATGAL